MMRFVLAGLAFLAAALFQTPVQAQDRAWVQIEALPSLAEAVDRARAWAAVFPDVQGYALRGGDWYGIVLGPYDRAGADGRRRELLAENLIPRDSFLVFGDGFGAPFWPVGATLPATGPEPAPDDVAAALPEETATSDAGTPAPSLPDETPEEASASERLLGEEDRKALQTALQWFGFYTAAVDGAFGRGTRAAMAAWQEANGHDATGILTTAQRAELLSEYEGERAAFGFQTMTEAEAGIEITYPAAMFTMEGYEPPFVNFAATDGSDARLILISMPGDRGALTGLYEMLQQLAIMPPDGPRTLGEASFSIRGDSAARTTVAEVGLSRGLIKGWMLSWPTQDARMERALATLRTSFRPVGERALDPGMVPLDEAMRQGLIAGLETQRPRLSRSGFYVDARGAVLTTAEAVDQCRRITLDGAEEASITLVDDAAGLALLSPRRALSPPAVAAFQLAPDRIGAEVAVSGYSYEDRLYAPVLTFGTLADAKGLNGEAGLKRLALAALPGDAGGPVLDGTGAVLGMLLPRPADGARVLPDDVAHAAMGQTIATALAPSGITLTQAATEGALAPEDLARQAARMTVLVSCWD